MKNLKFLLFISVVISLTSFNTKETLAVDEVVGEVIWEGSDCDYLIVETKRYFVLVEWYRGRLYEDDKVRGDLHKYGFENIINTSRNNSEVKIYIENYWTDIDTCYEWLKENEHCEFDE